MTHCEALRDSRHRKEQPQSECDGELIKGDDEYLYGEQLTRMRCTKCGKVVAQGKYTAAHERQ